MMHNSGKKGQSAYSPRRSSVPSSLTATSEEWSPFQSRNVFQSPAQYPIGQSRPIALSSDENPGALLMVDDDTPNLGSSFGSLTLSPRNSPRDLNNISPQNWTPSQGGSSPGSSLVSEPGSGWQNEGSPSEISVQVGSNLHSKYSPPRPTGRSTLSVLTSSTQAKSLPRTSMLDRFVKSPSHPIPSHEPPLISPQNPPSASSQLAAHASFYPHAQPNPYPQPQPHRPPPRAPYSGQLDRHQAHHSNNTHQPNPNHHQPNRHNPNHNSNSSNNNTHSSSTTSNDNSRNDNSRNDNSRNSNSNSNSNGNTRKEKGNAGNGRRHSSSNAHNEQPCQPCQPCRPPSPQDDRPREHDYIRSFNIGNAAAPLMKRPAIIFHGKVGDKEDALLQQLKIKFTLYVADTTPQANVLLKSVPVCCLITKLGDGKLVAGVALARNARKSLGQRLYVVIFSTLAAQCAPVQAECTDAGCNMVSNSPTEVAETCIEALKVLGRDPFSVQESTYTCPLCKFDGLVEDELCSHVVLFHGNEANVRDVKCPICALSCKNSRLPFPVHVHKMHGVAGRQRHVLPRKQHHTYIFALVVCQRKRDGRFLMVNEPASWGWWIPGGRVEWGEGLRTAALREAREEAGVEIELAGILKVEYSSGPSRTRQRVIFFAHPKDEDVQPKTVPDYHSRGACWVDKDEVERLPLRGDEPKHWFNYVNSGGHVHAMSLLSLNEDEEDEEVAVDPEAALYERRRDRLSSRSTDGGVAAGGLTARLGRRPDPIDSD